MFTQINRPPGVFWGTSFQAQVLRLGIDDVTGDDPPLGFIPSGSHGIRKTTAATILELSDFVLLERMPPRRQGWTALRLVVNDSQLGALHRRRSLLSRHRPVLVLTRCDGSLARCVQFLATLQLPIEISPVVFLTKDPPAMRDLSQRLLFSPFVKTPVQPYFDLLRWVLSPDGASTLWDICREKVGQYLYLTRDGRITLSQRWADGGRYFGHVNSNHREFRTSELYRSLRALQAGGYKLDPQCGHCPVGGFCAGFLRSLCPAQDCSAFLAAHEMFVTHAAGIEAVRGSLGAEQRKELKYGSGPPTPVAMPTATASGNKETGTSAAIVLVSAACTNDCIFCAPAHQRNKGVYLSDGEVEDFIQRCAADGVATLIFSGSGEPTLNPRLPDFIASAAKAGIHQRVITSNGTSLSSDLLIRLERTGTNAIVFSLHGIGATHDAVARRVGSYERVQRNLKAARELGLGVGLNTCLVRANLPEVKALLDLGHRFCTLTHTLSFPEWSGNAQAHCDLLAAYDEAREALANIDWTAYPFASVDNFPMCMTPARIRNVYRPRHMAHLDSEGAKRVATAMNFGNNRIPDQCKREACPAIGDCCGVDRRYLQERGSSEFTPRLFAEEGRFSGGKRSPGTGGCARQGHVNRMATVEKRRSVSRSGVKGLRDA